MRTAVVPLNSGLIFSVNRRRFPSLLSLSPKPILLRPSSRTSLRTLTTARSPLMAGEASDAVYDDAVKYGFERPEMYSGSLANTVDPYGRHVFLCYKDYESWPSHVENSGTDLLPKLFSSAIKSRKDDMQVKTRLTICGGCKSYNGNESSDGDVYIFPEMIKYRGLKDLDVDAFVDDVLVNGKHWASGVQEVLKGTYVFVCAHGSRDKRCGVCGPVLIEKFQEEIKLRVLEDQVFVSACSHIGGHKYAGNVIIFSRNAEGKVAGDWYGYVTPNDVPDLLDMHIGKGEIIEKLWRGQMGGLPSAEGAVKAAGQKHTPPPKERKSHRGEEKPHENGNKGNVSGCCQGANGVVSCCQDGTPRMNGEAPGRDVKPKFLGPSKAWLGKWEQSDILMAAAVVGAAATVAVAFSFYKRSG
ncbi:hypothetical protein Nepgr_025759 [Nepenthes gracilis]|uniref:Altered inheritance of mitochondria protein 32 n=1 Tax=Nepenthes gracilis TaxID=150966 RepID=A0AAD3T8H2_NEPGR|nr:hypothetical protein Nepgr_025759 [Nepenthes gracilis]